MDFQQVIMAMQFFVVVARMGKGKVHLMVVFIKIEGYQSPCIFVMTFEKQQPPVLVPVPVIEKVIAPVTENGRLSSQCD